MQNQQPKRINITLPPDVLEQLDRLAVENLRSRSATVQMLVKRASK